MYSKRDGKETKKANDILLFYKVYSIHDKVLIDIFLICKDKEQHRDKQAVYIE